MLIRFYSTAPATPFEGGVPHPVTTPPPGNQPYAAAAGAIPNSVSGEWTQSASIHYYTATCLHSLYASFIRALLKMLVQK